MKYYCIGIKGAGMSTLANILYDLGNEVSGYDDYKDYKFTMDGLVKRGIPIFYDEHEIDKETIVTFSGAIDLEHHEIKRVRELGLVIKSYEDILGEISSMFKTICISGTHGKTTTSLMLANILNDELGCNYFVGDGSGYANKDNSYFVLESCEYKKNFLHYSPFITLVTNIELEHTECYKDIDDIITTFNKLVNKSRDVAILCGDYDTVRKIKTYKQVIYYGLNDNNNVTAKNVILDENGSSYDLYIDSQFIRNIHIPLYGKHMVVNSLGVIAVCKHLGVCYDTIIKNLNKFNGANRRFTVIEVDKHVIIDDYAHHPTEIKVTIDSVRQKYPNKRVVVVFLPNTYSRTLALFDDFVNVLNGADKAYLMDIYCDREKKEDYGHIESSMIVDKLDNGEMISIDTANKLLNEKNAVVCFLSCTNISKMKDKYISLLKEN